MPESMQNDKQENQPASFKGLLIDLIQVIGTALILTFILLIFIQPSIVKGDSMYPTLHNADKLILWKLGDFDAGDIVVFDSHDAQNDKYVKRIIATAGDHIVISDSTVFVNDEPLDEAYINEAEFGGNVNLVVPDGELFVLGDNRNHSNDSRAFGCISLKDVDGKVVFNFDKMLRNIFHSTKQ